MVYDSSTNEYYFSKEGYEWFNNIYCVSNKMYQRIQTDLIWHQEYFRKRMMYLQNEYLDLAYSNVKIFGNLRNWNTNVICPWENLNLKKII